MRKRSEVRAAQQQTIDDAKGQGEQPSKGSWVLCTNVVNDAPCGTRMSMQAAKDNDGECVRCAAKLPGFGAGPAAAPARAAAAEPDPWELTPEGQRKADAERAKTTAAKQVVTGTDEETLGVLAARLANRGYRVSLIDLAARTPQERKLASQWVDGDSPSVAILAPWLAKHRDEALALGNHKQAAVAPYDPPAGSMAAAGMSSVEPQTVSYSWGAEKFSPKNSYSTCEVGPFLATTTVRRAETPTQAYQRLASEVTAMAEAERDRKLASFIKKLVGIGEQVAKAGS